MLTKHIWVYDDDILVEEDLVMVLSEAGYSVQRKESDEISNYIKNPQGVDPELIISNPTPLKVAVPINCPVIIISGHMPKYLPSSKDMVNGMILHKPFLPFQLKNAVRIISERTLTKVL